MSTKVEACQNDHTGAIYPTLSQILHMDTKMPVVHC